MPKNINISEFTYGYAFTENLIYRCNLNLYTAPIFPSLRDEGNWGFDVRVGSSAAPLFFQFKKPELMLQRPYKGNYSAKIKNFSLPVLRIALNKRQHDLLRNLEGNFPGSVFYVSTLLKDRKSFNTSYCKKEVHLSSAFFPPRVIGKLPSGDRHHIVYDDSRAYGSNSQRFKMLHDYLPIWWYWDIPHLLHILRKPCIPCRLRPNITAFRCSEPELIDAMNFWELEKKTIEYIDREEAPIIKTIDKIRRAVLELLPNELREAEKEIFEAINTWMLTRYRGTEVPGRDEELIEPDADRLKVLTNFLVIRELACIGLGVEMVLAQRPIY